MTDEQLQALADEIFKKNAHGMYVYGDDIMKQDWSGLASMLNMASEGEFPSMEDVYDALALDEQVRLFGMQADFEGAIQTRNTAQLVRLVRVAESRYELATESVDALIALVNGITPEPSTAQRLALPVVRESNVREAVVARGDVGDVVAEIWAQQMAQG